MTDDIRAIINKARLLSDAIENLEISRKYESYRRRMQHDRTASDLYAKLVAMGKELNAKMVRGEIIESGLKSETELLKRDIDENELVKEFIMSQKEYLEVIRRVIERIKNPVQ